MTLSHKIDMQSVPWYGNTLRNGGRVVFESQINCNGLIYEK